MSTTAFYWTSLQTPMGNVLLIASEKEIIWTGVPGSTLDEGRSWLVKHNDTMFRLVHQENRILARAVKELKDYFDGKNVQFSGPFHLEGTSFQQQVWHEMMQIPYGKTRSYGEVAKRVGRPAASRAVGGACRANPIAILVPCHRIVGSTGALTGYAGPSNTAMKKTLLDIESAGAHS